MTPELLAAVFERGNPSVGVTIAFLIRHVDEIFRAPFPVPESEMAAAAAAALHSKPPPVKSPPKIETTPPPPPLSPKASDSPTSPGKDRGFSAAFAAVLAESELKSVTSESYIPPSISISMLAVESVAGSGRLTPSGTNRTYLCHPWWCRESHVFERCF
jgi:hypothetical protein